MWNITSFDPMSFLRTQKYKYLTQFKEYLSE